MALKTRVRRSLRRLVINDVDTRFFLFKDFVGEQAVGSSQRQTESSQRQTGRKALDVGCGGGVFSHFLQQKGFDVTAVDVENKLRFPGISFKKHNLEDPLPFPDNYFDACLCLEVIEHVSKDKQLVKEFSRVLRPGGSLILSTPNTLAGNEAPSTEEFGHKRTYTKDEIRLLLEKNDFAVTKTRLVGWVFAKFFYKTCDKLFRFCGFGGLPVVLKPLLFVDKKLAGRKNNSQILLCARVKK